MENVKHRFGTRQSVEFSHADWTAHVQLAKALEDLVDLLHLDFEVPKVCIPDAKELNVYLTKTNYFFTFAYKVYWVYHKVAARLYDDFDVQMWFTNTPHGTLKATLGVDDVEYESHVLHSHLDACTWLLKSLHRHITDHTR